MRKTGWKIAGASVQGPSHKAKNQPCQDHFSYKINKNKLVACVSDGAGSSNKSKIGAKVICETICSLLINSNKQNIVNSVHNAIEVAREKLILHRTNKEKSKNNLIDYSATVVGCFFDGKDGFIFQIGDGAIITILKTEEKRISKPQNGDFANETFFYTMNEWKKLLKIQKISNLDSVILMSDGVTPFALTPDNKNIIEGFVNPITDFLTNNNKVKSCKSLANTLNSAEARKANKDDKTLFWAKYLG